MPPIDSATLALPASALELAEPPLPPPPPTDCAKTAAELTAPVELPDHAGDDGAGVHDRDRAAGAALAAGTADAEAGSVTAVGARCRSPCCLLPLPSAGPYRPSPSSWCCPVRRVVDTVPVDALVDLSSSSSASAGVTAGGTRGRAAIAAAAADRLREHAGRVGAERRDQIRCCVTVTAPDEPPLPPLPPRPNDTAALPPVPAELVAEPPVPPPPPTDCA